MVSSAHVIDLILSGLSMFVPLYLKSQIWLMMIRLLALGCDCKCVLQRLSLGLIGTVEKKLRCVKGFTFALQRLVNMTYIGDRKK